MSGFSVYGSPLLYAGHNNSVEPNIDSYKETNILLLRGVITICVSTKVYLD